MKCEYCPTCGAKTTQKDIGDEGPTAYCLACETPLFDLASPCVLVLAVNRRDEAALLKQHYISKEHWVLVAGYNKIGETAEETVRREVAEETGLRVTSCRYIASYYLESKQALLLGFLARVDGELSADSVEVDDAKWVPLDDIEPLLRPGSIGRRLFRKARALLEQGDGLP